MSSSRKVSSTQAGGDPYRFEPPFVRLVYAAIHAGHEVRGELKAHIALSAADRLWEEDPFTDTWLPSAGACGTAAFAYCLSK